MQLTAHKLAVFASLGSLFLLLGAYGFQALGYAPCQMCYWQRYPHMVAIGVGALLFVLPARFLIPLGALATVITSLIGFFHAGVEQKWWNGPSSCTGGGAGLSELTGADLLNTDINDKLVMCDEISWQFLGLSMPAWNGVLSLILAALWFAAWRVYARKKYVA